MADRMLPMPALAKPNCSECSQQCQVDNYLRDLVKKMAYDLFTCMKCKKINPALVYFCLNNHCYCSVCIANKCLKCDVISEFSEGQQLKNVTVTCDWPRCNENVRLVNYINHKRDCLSRPYKCPLKQCQVTVHSTDELQTHWHATRPALITNKYYIEYSKYDIYEFYWLLNQELYHVLVDFSKEKTDLLIEEINVLPNNFKFNFHSFCGGYKKWEDSQELSNLGGKYKLIKAKSYYNYEIEKIRISC